MSIIQFFFIVLNYVNPTYYYKKIDEQVASRTTNISDTWKKWLARFFLGFYLTISFMAIWLTYRELHSAFNTIANVTSSSCVQGMGDCFDEGLVSYVKQNHFSIEAFIEILYLMIGVIVGNIGWDLAAKIKKNGFDVLPNAMSTLTIILLVSIVFTVFAEDYLPNNTVFENSFLYRIGGWGIMTLVFVFAHFFYYLKKSENKKTSK